MKQLLPVMLAPVLLLLAACGGEAPTPAVSPDAEPAAMEPAAEAPPAIAALLDEALAGSHRSYGNRSRDRWRNPKETLMFFGLQAGMTVVEIYPGSGWYTEVLAPVLRGRGKLVAAHFDPAIPPDYRQRYYDDYMNMLAARPDLYDEVEVLQLGEPAMLNLGEDGSADMVVTFRNIHSMINDGSLEPMLAAMFHVLRPGGILGIVQHRADEGVDVAESARMGYVPQSHVIAMAEAAGFRFEASSEINANPQDTRDHAGGVWSLPPTLSGDMDLRESKLAIGESDRMTLRFVRP